MRQCTCGSTKFTAHQICRHDIMVDGDNNFLMDVGIYDSETPYEPYHCARCDKEYKDLADLPEVDDTAAVPHESIGGASEAEAEQLRVWEQHMLSEAPKSAIHIEWGDLDKLFCGLLTALLSREILAEVNRQEYYYWEVSLFTPITSAETDILFEITQASDCDRDENLYDEDSLITELCEGLCKKLIAKLLPFDLKLTRADDEGVWFIGDIR